MKTSLWALLDCDDTVSQTKLLIMKIINDEIIVSCNLTLIE